MKKYLLPQSGQYYKANLHMHTDISDGRLSPEQVKEIYKAHGYSVVAFTDHDVMITHHELSDDTFLALSGFEAEFNEMNQYPSIPGKKTCHLCFIAKSKTAEIQPCYNEKYAYIGSVKKHRHKVKIDKNNSPFKRDYSPENINEMIRICRENGFFVTYNHPTWSLEKYGEYIRYDGMNAMEIYNHECNMTGYPAYVPTIYDDMLMSGKKIFAIAADDCHKKSSACGGYIMIKAGSLDYEVITDAIDRGNFYASMGPEIKDLYIEDFKVHISCSDAIAISLYTGARKAEAVYAEEGEILNHASFPIDETYKYIRITVRDVYGRYANTNAYFLEDLK